MVLRSPSRVRCAGLRPPLTAPTGRSSAHPTHSFFKRGRNIGWRWVCGRNRQLHLVEYDYTQVESAMKKGQLASEFKTVIGESYRESARRARQKRRNDFP